MTSLFRKIALSLSLFFIATWSWSGTFTVDFDDAQDRGALHWGLNTDEPIGKWGFSNGAYQIEAVDHAAGAYWGEADWTDYTMSVRARSLSESGCIAITTRVHDPLNFYLWALDVVGNRLIWYRGIDGEFMHWTVDKAPGDALEEHVFKVVVSGNRFQGYFDGELIREWQDEFHPSGRIGIGVGCGAGTSAVFDDLVITGEHVPSTVPVLERLAVAPTGKLATTWGDVKRVR